MIHGRESSGSFVSEMCRNGAVYHTRGVVGREARGEGLQGLARQGECTPSGVCTHTQTSHSGPGGVELGVLLGVLCEDANRHQKGVGGR
jgi:hypothetical protein